ncbi:tyrosine-type recombinase/integrase [Fusobacterium sp. THCT1E2]
MQSKFYIDLLSLKTEMEFRRYSISTQRTYYRIVEDFLNYIGKDAIDIKREDVIRYLDSCLRELSQNTILIKLNALEFFFEEILGMSITENILKYKREFKKREFISPEKLGLLIASVEDKKRLVYKIIVETGMRSKQVCALRVNDLNVEEWKLKGLKISKELGKEILDYCDKKYIERYIFFIGDDPLDEGTIRHWLREDTKKHLGELYSISDIRYGVALEMIKKGEEEKAVEYLQVKSISGVRQYYKRAGYEYK